MELFAEDLKIKLVEEIKKAEDPAQEAAEVIEYAITQLNERVEEEIKKAAEVKKDKKDKKDDKPEGFEGEEAPEEELGITQEAFDLAVEEARQEGMEEGKKTALESVVEDTSVGKALIAIEGIKQIVLPLVNEDLGELAGEGNVYEELETLRAQVASLEEAKDAATKKADDLKKKADEAAEARGEAEELQKKVTEMLDSIDVPAVREKAEALIEKAETVDEGFIAVLENFIEVEAEAAPISESSKEEEALTEEQVEGLLGEGQEEEIDEDTKQMMESLKHISGLVSNK